jgi:nucleoid DNA-binding protein
VSQRLTLKKLIGLMIQRHPKIPSKVIKVSVETIFEAISTSLASGQEVSLRKFGRLIPRHYTKSPNKKFGLIFHPSPQLTARVNRKKKKS